MEKLLQGKKTIKELLAMRHVLMRYIDFLEARYPKNKVVQDTILHEMDRDLDEIDEKLWPEPL